MAGRVSQIVGEILAEGSPAARASQVVGETLASGSPNARASQIVAETAASGSPFARASQIVGEALASGSPFARVSQLVIEVLVRSFQLVIPPVYPDLPGLTYPVIWRPNFFAQSQKTASGAEVDIALADSPIHEFELIYSVLRNNYGVGSIEFKTLFGFFGRMNGTAGRFLYKNPHDNSITSQPIGTTDGTSVTYGPFMRTFGVGANVMTEAIGYIDLTMPIAIYLDGVLQDADSYTIVHDAPVNQLVQFRVAPAAGKAITGDYSYFYYCKFANPKLDFNEFMSNLFELQQVVIRSCRKGT